MHHLSHLKILLLREGELGAAVIVAMSAHSQVADPIGVEVADGSNRPAKAGGAPSARRRLAAGAHAWAPM